MAVSFSRLSNPRMQSAAETVEQYLAELDGIRRQAVSVVRSVILDNLPNGYEETMQFGMITYVVPLNVLADTYNGQPLMYIGLASQKRYMSLYLTSVYADKSAEEWFRNRYAATGKRLNMGKSCVRFKKSDELPLELIGEVVAKTSMAEFVEIYRASRSGHSRK